MTHPCRLYVITPPKFTLSTFIPEVEAAFAGGDIACLQLRMKEASDTEIMEAAKALLPICQQYNAAFIVNDRADIAAQCGADGVHIGQEDLAKIKLSTIRKTVGADAVIGVTCHASRHLAMDAGETEADYVAFGAFYPTTSKPMEKLEKWGTPDIDILTWWSESATLPCVAIGGITPENLTPLVQAGADFVAVINGIWNHPQGAAEAVKAYNQAIQIASGESDAEK